MIRLPRSPRFSRALLPVLVAGTFGLARAAEDANAALPKQSPFAPAGGAVAAAPSNANESIEFAGVSTIGKKTDLIFYDKAAKKSRWVGIGETVDGISVVKYDERSELAVVRINGVQKTLALRKGTGPSNAPVPVAPMPMPAPLPTHPVTVAQPLPATTPLPSAGFQTATPAAPQTPEAQAQARAETEARMLVSDLLEIGMAQRKAYEEAQRRAAQQGAQAPGRPQPGQPPAPKAAGK